MTRWRNDSGRTLLHGGAHIKPGDVVTIVGKILEWCAVARALSRGELTEVPDDLGRDSGSGGSDGERAEPVGDLAADAGAGRDVDRVVRGEGLGRRTRSRR